MCLFKDYLGHQGPKGFSIVIKVQCVLRVLSRRTCIGEVPPENNLLLSSTFNLVICWLEVMRVMHLWWKVEEKRGNKEIGLKVDVNLPDNITAAKLSVSQFITKA